MRQSTSILLLRHVFLTLLLLNDVKLFVFLLLSLDYLKNANLFADDVKKEHDAEERKKFKAALEENRNKSPGGSDLGLW